MNPTPETIEKLKAEHGEVHLVEHGGHAIVVKPPSRAAWKRFRSAPADRRIDASEQLLRDCLVWPDPATFEQLLDRRPGLADTFGGELVGIAGASDEATSRKL